jgi:hypothetical protein
MLAEEGKQSEEKSTVPFDEHTDAAFATPKRKS